MFYVSVTVVTVNVIVCSLVLSQHESRPASRIFLTGLSWLGLWAFSDVIMYFPIIEGYEQIIVRFNVASGFITGGLVFNSVLYLVNRRKYDAIFWFLILATFAAVLGTFFTDHIVKGFSVSDQGIRIHPGDLFPLASMLPVVAISWGLSFHIATIIKSRNVNYRRIGLVNFVGSATAVVAYSATNIVLPCAADFVEAIRLSSSSSLIFFFGVYYAVEKYNFLSVSAERAAEELFNDTLDGVLLLDIDGNVKRLNKSARKMLGIETESVYPIRFHSLLKGYNLEEGFVNAKIDISENGVKRFLDLSCSKIERFGMEVGKLVLIRDVTAQRRFENILKESREKLEKEVEFRAKQMQKMQKVEGVGALAGEIAHDFNNLLSAIMGFSTIVKDEMPPHSQLRRDMDEVLIASKRAQEIVRQILDFSRAKDIEPQNLIVENIFEEAISLIKASLPSTIEIKATIEPHCGYIIADPVQINLVFVNLGMNAYQAMKNIGKLSLKAYPTFIKEEVAEPNQRLKPGRYICFEFTDTGCGIEESHIPLIFEPFFTTRQPGQGTGLGLSTVLGIVESHDGAVTVESKVDEGTTLKVILPSAESVKAKGRDKKRELTSGNEKILVIGEDEYTIKLMRRILEPLGYVVSGMTNHLAALEKLGGGTIRVDLIILNKSAVKGILMRAARHICLLRPDLPVIVMVDSMDEKISWDPNEYGVIRTLERPVSKFELGRVVRETLDRASAGRVEE